MDIINAIENEYKKEEIVPFKVGDTVNVHLKIKEGNKERIQVFTGTVIKRQNSGLNETFSQLILQRLKKSKLKELVKLDVLDYTT